MTEKRFEFAVKFDEIPVRDQVSAYPEPFFSRMLGRKKRQLGNHFGLQNFGINHTVLEPGAESSILHMHTKQDEFIYILEGNPTLVMEAGEQELGPGMVAGFAAGDNAHQLVNRSDTPVVYLEIGDRTPGDEGQYPRDDLKAVLVDGKWKFMHKDGQPY